MRTRNVVVGLCALAIAAGTATADIIKPPDIGPWWQPLDGGTGTYVYSSDFIAEGPDLTVVGMGTWLLSLTGTTQSLRFEIWGNNPAGGPDPSNVLGSTGSIHPNVTSTLDHYDAAVAPFTLVDGERYWFVATVVGEGGGAAYQFGGHTQNSVYNDNGTFWFSNDPNGINFDGQGLTPQIAFTVTLIPAPGALALLGIAGLIGTRRRRN